jgi:hypothetical protein
MLSDGKTQMKQLNTLKQEDFMDYSKLRYFVLLSSLALLAFIPGYGGTIGFLGFLGFLGLNAAEKKA